MQEEDRALEVELLADEKECAEHVMLVDLGRNDVGKVSVSGSVEIEALMQVWTGKLCSCHIQRAVRLIRHLDEPITTPCPLG